MGHSKGLGSGDGKSKQEDWFNRCFNNAWGKYQLSCPLYSIHTSITLVYKSFSSKCVPPWSHWVNSGTPLLKKYAFMYRNWELSRTLCKNLRLYLQDTSEPALTLWMLEENMKVLGQKRKTLLLSPGNMSFIFVPGSPCHPSPPQAKEVDLAGCCKCSRFVSQLKNSERRKPQSFIMSCKQTCPTFAPEADIIFVILDSKQIHALLQRETLALSSQVLCCISNLDKIIQNKKLLESLLTRDPRIIISQQESKLLSSVFYFREFMSPYSVPVQNSKA